MSNIISMYKTINSSLYKKMQINHTNMYFSYITNGEEVQIVLDDQEDVYSFYMGKSKGYWDVNNDNLNIERTFTIENPKSLFEENGITTDEGELGIGVHIYSRSSNFQTTIPLDETIINNDESVTIKFQHNFKSGELKGDVYFSLFVYLKNQISRVPMIANIPGMNLGEIDSFRITVDGDGSVFPIVEVEKVGQPLWDIVTNWTDINSDVFDMNNVRIEINSKHHMYNYLYNTTKPSQYLLVEVLSNAMAQIIDKVVKDEDFIGGGEAIPDSIFSIVTYWIDAFEVDISTLATISYSVRKNIESRFMS